MKGLTFIPDDFDPPRSLTIAGVEMAVLTLDDVAIDYEAVMESVDALPGLFAPDDTWPRGLTFRQNIIDLAWHEKEFQRRTSFAWGLWRPGRERYLGTAYVYPDPAGASTAHAVHWIRAGEDDDALRRDFRAAWEAWIGAWPMASARFSPEPAAVA